MWVKADFYLFSRQPDIHC